MRTEILYGPPGTGKTSTLLDRVEDFLVQGGDPERLAYVAFTRKAAGEAKGRLLGEHPSLDLPYMRTLHSLAYHLLRLKPGRVMSRETWREFGRQIGTEFTLEREAEDGEPFAGCSTDGDYLLRVYDLARACSLDLYDCYGRAAPPVPYHQVQRFVNDLQQFKRREGLLDFQDMMEECRAELDVDMFIVDEAQDLTPSQWTFARRLARRAKSVVLAGDDDQAIYEWAGASPGMMQSFQAKREVLHQSWRLPQKVWEIAEQTVSRISNRQPKQWRPREELGHVEFIRTLSHLDLKAGSWLLLCRERSGLARLEELARQAGVVYRRGGKWSNQTGDVRAVLGYEHLRSGKRLPASEARTIARYVVGLDWDGDGEVGWSDIRWPFSGRPDWMTALTRLSPESREYIRSLRANGESLVDAGRVQISTIHGVKGGEADHVVVADGMGHRTAQAWLASPDAEIRVWYVAVTRARKSLFILQDRRLNNFFA